MSSSRDAAAKDLALALKSFAAEHVWDLGDLSIGFNPLAAVVWDGTKYTSTSDKYTRDAFVAHAMVLLASKRLTLGWSRKRAAQQLVIYEGSGCESTLPNSWAKILEVIHNKNVTKDFTRHLLSFEIKLKGNRKEWGEDLGVAGAVFLQARRW